MGNNNLLSKISVEQEFFDKIWQIIQSPLALHNQGPKFYTVEQNFL